MWYFQDSLEKAFMKKAVRAVLHPRGTSIKEHKFSLKQAKFRLDRQNYQYWKERKREGVPLTTGSPWLGQNSH